MTRGRKKNNRAVRVRPIIRKSKEDHAIDSAKERAIEKDMDDFLTSNFYERGETVTPEQKLFYSVLALALKDYKRGRGLACNWIWSNNYAIGDFLWTCDALSICPKNLRTLISEGKIMDLDELLDITWTIRSNTLSKACERERRKKVRQQKKKMTT